MSSDKESLARSPLFCEYDKLAEFEDVSKSDITLLKALILNVVVVLGPHLDRVRMTFSQYTEHDLRHLLKVADHIYRFLPSRNMGDGTKVIAINGLELTYLWLAILLHDVGMFVSDADEKQKLLDSPEYKTFQRYTLDRQEAAKKAEDAGLTVRAQAIRDAIFAEFIRRSHAERVCGYTKKYLKDKLRFRGADLSPEIEKLCASHAWGVHESNDPGDLNKSVKILELRKLIGRTPVNLSYLACCLRLGDILDFDRTRTPLSAFHVIHFTEAMSVQEYNKHLSIEGVEVSKHRVLYDAKCKTPDDYVAIQHFLDWVDRELQECTRLVREFPAEYQERYQLKLAPVVDRFQIRMENPRFIAGAFRFQLDYDRIMALLMDKSLYPDSALFLRELLQNALDACRYQKALAEDQRMGDKYIPRIQVQDLSTLPQNPSNPDEGPRVIFRDNGIGMSQDQVEKYFMRVGKSYYRSPEFHAEQERLKAKGIHLDACSQFGIGFLSCFLGGNRIEVLTYRYGSKPLKITIEGPGKYFLIEQLDASPSAVHYNSPDDLNEDKPPRYPGTIITVYLRDGWHKSEDDTPDDDLIFRTLDAFAVNPEFEISISTTQELLPRVLQARRWDNWMPEFILSNKAETALWKEYLSPSVFSLGEGESRLRGNGAIWLLNDNGRPTPRKGLLRINADNCVHESNFTAASREFLISFERLSQEKRTVVTDAIALLHNSPKKTFQILSKLEFESQNSTDLRFHKLQSILSNLNSDEISWLQTLTRRMLGQKVLTNKDCYYWHSAKTEVAALAANDLGALGEVWVSEGVAPSCRLSLQKSYRFSLFGIEAPGGFQTWRPEIGHANREANWLPNGKSVIIDTYGTLAPQPAANRLFIPFERSFEVQCCVARAFIRQADKLRKDHLSEPEWQHWFRRFVNSWNSTILASAVRNEEFKLMEDILSIEYREKVGEACKRLSLQQLCKDMNVVVAHAHLSNGKTGVEEQWWLPNYAERLKAYESNCANFREVDLTPLADRLSRLGLL